MQSNGRTIFVKAGNTRLNLETLIALKYRPERMNSLSAALGSTPADYLALFSNGANLELSVEEGQEALAALDVLGTNGVSTGR